ncbi:DinB family protein [Streptomyces evansiae]|uniref:DinB family protein n=1 Tax=Streptomyces evansiae TaxID=3075535 RepID=UPI002887B48A|nr:DinB family protein [Streptomyces sp. DSM 41859]MDT0424418.1 DinB family protein [Streptomyces sp. DSM 41859]
MVKHVGPERPGDEAGALLAFLDEQRGGIRRATLGLTEEQARQRPCASELSLGGLLKHTAETEQGWLARARGTAPDTVRTRENWHESHALLDGETLEGTRAYAEKVARETEEWIRSRPSLDETFPLPEAPWFPDAEAVSLRWLLLHLIRETARHAGHADILREQLDGETAFALVAREG